jgi:hypothetical protein
VAATSKNVIKSELRCRNISDESQIGVSRWGSGSEVGRSERTGVAAPLVLAPKELGVRKRASVLSGATFCPAVLETILVTFDESAALERVPLELAAGLLDRRCWGRTE